MNPQELLLLLISVLSSVSGQLLLKLGAGKLGQVNISNPSKQIIGIITTPELILGLGFYGVGAIAYILLLTRVKLSVAGPAASLVYVFSVLFGHFIFKETVPWLQLVGLGLIVSGVILVVSQK